MAATKKKKTGKKTAKKLKKFSVEIRRSSVQATCVVVEAEDASKAEELAVEKLDDVPEEDWEYIDGDDEVGIVEEI